MSGSVRKFKMPIINENAKDYYKLVNLSWKKVMNLLLFETFQTWRLKELQCKN